MAKKKKANEPCVPGIKTVKKKDKSGQHSRGASKTWQLTGQGDKRPGTHAHEERHKIQGGGAVVAKRDPEDENCEDGESGHGERDVERSIPGGQPRGDGPAGDGSAGRC